MRTKVPNRAAQGATLLELILAMSLSILVLMAIGMAINLHFRMFDVRRTNVEEAQVARVTFKRIADDLRSTVFPTPPDLSGLETVLSNTAAAGVNALASGMGGEAMMGMVSASGAGMDGGGMVGGGAAGGQAGGQGGGQGQGGSASQASATGSQGGQGGQTGQGQGGQQASGGRGQSMSGGSSQSGGMVATSASGGISSSTSGQTGSTGGQTPAAAEEAEAPAIGLFGTSTELRIDISRLPRVDEYQGILSSDGQLSVVDIPSDVKTVTYFILDEEASGAAKAIGVISGAIKPSATGQGRGLMRSEVSRAIVAYAEASGEFESLYDNGRMLADEVVAIQFQYFDGTEWLAEWDSTEMGGLPKAVEIVLTILPTYAMTEEALGNLPPDAPPPEQIYRQVVYLPGSPLVPQSETETSTTEATTTETASGASPEVTP